MHTRARSVLFRRVGFVFGVWVGGATIALAEPPPVPVPAEPAWFHEADVSARFSRSGVAPPSGVRSRERRLPSGVLETVQLRDGKASFEVSVVTPELAARLFDRVASDSDNPFRFPESGCYARAHRMARQLDVLGIRVGKAFVEGDLRVESLNAKRGVVTWSFHVAPFVRVRDEEGKEQDVVLDPSLFQGPVSLDTWAQTQRAPGAPKALEPYCTSRFIYKPSERGTARSDYPASLDEDAELELDLYRMVQRSRDSQRVVLTLGNLLLPSGVSILPFPILQSARPSALPRNLK